MDSLTLHTIQTPSKRMPPAVKSARLLARLGRPQNVLYPGLLSILAARSSGTGWTRAVLCYVVIFCLYAVAATINNLRDTAVDIANGRHDNPLIMGTVPQQLIYASVGGHVALLLILQVWLRQPASILICFIFIVLCLMYSLPGISLQSRGFIATISLAICYGSLPLLLGSSQGSTLPSSILVLAVLQILLLAPLLLAKDYKDIVGDRRYGKRTPLVRYGKQGVMIAAGLSLVLWFGIVTGRYIFTPWYPLLLPLGVIWSTLVLYVHAKDARVHPLVYRATQLVVLILSGLLLYIS